MYIVSSGPMKYGSVVLPDQEVINELAAQGQVFRTDQNDGACAQNPAKIGPDNDGKTGRVRQSSAGDLRFRTASGVGVAGV